MWRKLSCVATVPAGLRRRPSTGKSGTRPLRQKEPPSPPRRLVRRQADLEARARPAVALASGYAPPADKLAPHTTARAQLESPAGRRAARESPAGSIAS